MGSGRSGIYYTTKGSSFFHHEEMIHIMEGEYDPDLGIARTHIDGGHTQDSIDFMKKNNIDFQIVKTYPNGVRIGNILDSEDPDMQSGSNHSWFPESWNQETIINAVTKIVADNNVKKLKNGGEKLSGTYQGVKITAYRRNGIIQTIFPNKDQ